MLLKFLVPILFLGVLTQTDIEKSLVGKWRRIDPNVKHQDTTSKILKWGDLQFNEDSTFHIEGNSATANSTIPGWHSGDEYNGTWELRNSDRLTLWLEPKQDKLLLPYKIIKLTNDTLVLRSGFLLDNENRDVTYLRL